jgi:hypothetical protein
MPNATDHLQPFHVFKAETVRVNALYWRTKYAYSRTAALLEALARAGTPTPDPRVDSLWPSIDAGEQGALTIRLSQLNGSLDDNLATLRRTSVLYLCSAFENALSAFFVLCGLYHPKAIDSSWPYAACPGLASDAKRLSELKRKAIKSTGKLKGKYSDRIQLLDTHFGLSLDMSKISSSKLDHHYAMRHLVAHDQGLIVDDDPSIEPKKVLSRSLNISEPDWKSMVDDFFKAISELDRAIKASVVTDHGVALALAHVLEEARSAGKRTIAFGDLKDAVARRWQMATTQADIEKALQALGRAVKRNRRGKLPRQVNV